LILIPWDYICTMSLLLLPLRIVYCFYALIIFIILMLLVIPVVVVASFFGKIKGGNWIYLACNYWADAWFFLVGIRHRNIYESPHDETKQYIFVANHISYLDAPVIVKTLRQKVRVLGKVEFGNIPIFGYIYRRAVVTVDRKSASQRANSVRILKSVLKRKISIFMFPEGTFNLQQKPLKEFYDGAFRIAIETQTPIKPLLFLDAHDRMHYSSIFTLLPGRSRSIFLKEIPVDGLIITDLPLLKQRVYAIMEERLREYQASWLNN
jgi:1-acyl-sn-glycerol-3-phosphate acyltransferase